MADEKLASTVDEAREGTNEDTGSQLLATTSRPESMPSVFPNLEYLSVQYPGHLSRLPTLLPAQSLTVASSSALPPASLLPQQMTLLPRPPASFLSTYPGHFRGLPTLLLSRSLTVASSSTLPPASLLPQQMAPLPSLPTSSLSTSREACNKQDQSGQNTTAHNSSNSKRGCFIKEEDEVQILELLRKEVPKSLQSKDLADISRRLQEIGLVPQEVKNNMDIMHSSVLHESKCRYLMVHVCQSIKSVSREDKIGRLTMLYRVLCKYVALSHIGKYINDVITGNQVKSGEVVPATFLNPESHLGHLCDLLSSYAYKWEHLGIAFHLSDNEIRTIESKSTDNVLRLRSVLNTWLSGTSRFARTPTLDNLCEALRSTSVNLSRLVGKVKKIVDTDSTINMRNQVNDIQITSVNNLNPNFCQVSSDMSIKETNEATAILLEVFVSHSECSTISYNWYKDEKQLNVPFPILCVKIKDIKAEGSYYCSYHLTENEYHSRPIQVHVETLLDSYRSLLISRYSSQPEVEPDSWPHVSRNTYINLAVVGNKISHVSDRYRETIRGDADDVFRSKSSMRYSKVFEKIVYGSRILIVGRPGSGKTTLVHRISQDWAKGALLGKVKSLFLVSLQNFRGNPSIGLKTLLKCCFDNVEDAKIVCDYIEKHQGLGVCFILDGLDEYQPPQTQIYYIDQLIKGQTLPQAIVIVASRPAATDKYRINRINLTIEVLGFFKEQIKEYIESYHFKDRNKCFALQKYLVDHVNVYRMCYLPIQTAMICFLYDVSDDSLPDRESKIYYDFTVHTIMRNFSRKNHDVKLLTLDSLDRQHKNTFHQICKLAFEKAIKSEQVIHEDENIEESLGLITVDRKATRHGKQKTYSFCHLTFQEFLAAYHISEMKNQEQLAVIKSHGPKNHLYMVFKFYCGLAKFKVKDIRFKTLMEVAEFDIVHSLQCCYESQQPDTCNLVAHNNIIRIDKDFKTPSDYTCLGYFVMNARHNPVRIIECLDNRAKSVCADLKYADIEFADCECADLKSSNLECAEAFVKATRNTGITHVPIEMWVSLDSYDLSCPMMHRMHVSPSVLLYDIVDPDEFIPAYMTSYRSQSEIELVAIEGVLDSYDWEKFSKQTEHNCKDLRIVSLPKYKTDYGGLLPTITSIYCYPVSSFANIAFHRAEILLISYHLKCEIMCGYCGTDNIDIEHESCLCTHLSLFNCNVNDERAALLAEGLKHNFSVEVLKLVANDIGDEGTMAIASGITSSSHLRYLDLSLNKIGDEGAMALVNVVKTSSLNNLLMFGNHISNCLIAELDTENSIELFHTLNIPYSIKREGLLRINCLMNDCPRPLSSIRQLHSLYLKLLSIDDGDTEIFVKMLKFSSLYELSLVDINIGSDGMKLLCNSLVLRNVHILNLSHTSIGSEGTAHLCQALQGISHQILTLNLGHNNIGVEGALAVAECLRVSQSLCELDLSYNDIQDTGTEAICESLNSGNKLQVLNLASNGIGATGCLAVATLLEQHGKSVISLDLSCNNLIDVGAICLARGLRFCLSLQKLHLNNNCIGHVGVEAVAEVLMNTHLMELILENNFINNKGAKALAYGLQSCNKLTTVNLSNNVIGDVGAGSLAEALSHCSRLHILELNGNLISGSGAVSFLQRVQHCQALTTLKLGDHSIKGLEILYLPHTILYFYYKLKHFFIPFELFNLDLNKAGSKNL